jgi:hypothetical protein
MAVDMMKVQKFAFNLEIINLESLDLALLCCHCIRNAKIELNR